MCNDEHATSCDGFTTCVAGGGATGSVDAGISATGVLGRAAEAVAVATGVVADAIGSAD